MKSRIAVYDAPRQAALALLPLLLSNPPFIPASFTSTSLNRRHQILETSPEDVEEYLITDAYPTDYPTATRSIELLRALSSLVEEQGAAVVRRILFKCPEKDRIIVGVELGDKRLSEDALLLLLLSLEGDEKSSDSYKYDNILPVNVDPGPWFESFEEAVDSCTTSTEIKGHVSRAFAKDSNIRSGESSGTPLDVLQTLHDRKRNNFDPSAQDEEQEGGGEYIIDAEEFWDGFESDGDEADIPLDSEHTQQYHALSDEDIEVRLREEEDRYWELYDQTGAAATAQEDRTVSDYNNLDTLRLKDDATSSLEQMDMMTSRHSTVRLMLKDAWKLMQEAGTNHKQTNEEEFLQMAREVTQET